MSLQITGKGKVLPGPAYIMFDAMTMRACSVVEAPFHW
jgi:hypothetical protein